MSENETHFERISFWELLKRYPVQIPVIQRDYAQGRPGNERVIDDFLDALRGAVTGPPVELDFIFGNSDAGPFRPLDGQQRLTTLFLLHWYAARRMAGLAVEDYTATLSKFSYDTRVSSRDFCEKLVNEAVAVVGVSKDDPLSGRIRDYHWFAQAWEYDPTVAGMLAVLDKIAVPKDATPVASWPDDLWSRLTSPGAAPITFSLVELERFGLTDDLYIKMNARGKALTAFENFKAMLGARVLEEKWDADREIEAQFGTLVDNRWTDFFWRFCPSEESGLKPIDGAFLSFFAHSLGCSMARGDSSAKMIADAVKKLLNDPEGMEAQAFTQPYYEELRARLEQLCEKPKAVAGEVRRLWELADDAESAGRTIMEEVIHGRGPQYKPRLILYAQMKLHEAAAAISEERMNDWRRVVRNVFVNTEIESPESFIGGVRLLDELGTGVESIYDFLATATIVSGFAGSQVQEERRKARLLVRNPEHKSLIHRLEDTRFLRGRISFALDCVNADPAPENFDFEQLGNVATVIEGEFGQGITSEIRRAFFTIGDGGFYRYWYSRFNIVDLPKYRLICDDREFRSFTEPWHSSRSLLKSFVLALIGKSCAQLIAEYQPTPGTPNWRTRLIREPDLIGRATHHHIALDEEGGVVYPINGQRPRNNPATKAYLEEKKIQ
jgi:hypothetical protein